MSRHPRSVRGEAIRLVQSHRRYRRERRIARAVAAAFDDAGHLPRTREALARALDMLRVEISEQHSSRRGGLQKGR